MTNQTTMIKTLSTKVLNNKSLISINLIQQTTSNGYNQKTANFTKFRNQIQPYLNLLVRINNRI